MAVEITPTPNPSLFVGKGVAPSTAKVRLVNVATGAVYEAWPVDAKEHIAAGDFVREEDYVAPNVPAAAAETPPVDPNQLTLDPATTVVDKPTETKAEKAARLAAEKAAT